MGDEAKMTFTSVVAALVVWCFGACFVGFPIGNHVGKCAVKREAVREGVAEYVPDETGAAQFQWKKQSAE